MRMRSLAAALLVLAAACATGARSSHPEDDRPSIVGSYVLSRVDNRGLPTYSPTEPNVTLMAGRMVLGNGGAFSLSLLARTSPQLPPAERSVHGSYENAGDSIVTVTLADGSEGAPTVYHVRRAGVQLTMRDPQRHRWEWVIR